MAKPRSCKILLTQSAQRDLARVMERSLEEFGERAAIRYDALITRALKDIGRNPERPGSREMPEIMIEGARLYPISLSRRGAGRPAVKQPRHVLLYRRRGDWIEVARILHDSLDLERHLPGEYRRPD